MCVLNIVRVNKHKMKNVLTGAIRKGINVDNSIDVGEIMRADKFFLQGFNIDSGSTFEKYVGGTIPRAWSFYKCCYKKEDAEH